GAVAKKRPDVGSKAQRHDTTFTCGSYVQQPDEFKRLSRRLAKQQPTAERVAGSGDIEPLITQELDFAHRQQLPAGSRTQQQSNRRQGQTQAPGKALHDGMPAPRVASLGEQQGYRDRNTDGCPDDCQGDGDGKAATGSVVEPDHFEPDEDEYERQAVL